MRKIPSLAGTSAVLCLLSLVPNLSAQTFRPPAVPLVTHDPYFSVWSMNDRLTDDWTKHWTGTIHAMCGLVRIDGKAYRFMAPPQLAVPPMKQLGVDVLPTRTIYHFEEAGVHLTLVFTTPALLHDLDILARPVSYVTWHARSADKQPHAVSLYFDVTGEWAVNNAEQEVVWGRYKVGELNVMRIGSKDQPVLAKAGDNLRIDWGYMTLAVPPQDQGSSIMASDRKARGAFIASGKLDDSDDLRMPRAARDDWPVLACSFDLGKVGEEAVSRHLLLAYDDGYSIEYHRQKLRPYWRRKGMEMPALLRQAAQEYKALAEKCRRFDVEIMADLERAGGLRYAKLCALAFRQCVAAHKLVAAPDGTPLYFSKENFSNGCIATVDVTCPSCPFFLLFNTKLLAGQLIPILDYAKMPRWKHRYAPHDLGTYPKANGQVYGGGEKSDRDQMPVEECGNMLLMMAALAKTEGNADLARKYWPTLKQWADYLKEKGLDPENQLCTDDFAGHLAHNTNLSVKAIVALGGYALLCDMAGKKDEAVGFRKTAKDMARQWVKMADDGDHFRLAFDRPGTWSQVYNLVWDKLLGLELFPPKVSAKSIAFYKTKQEKYGLPLDSRKTYAKLDWTVWTATLATKPADFQALVDPLYRFADESKNRVPLTDWYWTHDGKQAGFQARSTVGGIYIKLLADPAIWKKWSQRALVAAQSNDSGDVAILKKILATASGWTGNDKKARTFDSDMHKQLDNLAGQVADPVLRARTQKLVADLESTCALHDRVRFLLDEVKRLKGKIVTEPGGPEWLKKLVGQEALVVFTRLTEIELNEHTDGHAPKKSRPKGEAVTDAWLKNLTGLPDLTRLELSGTSISDAGLVSLGNLKNLEILNICLTPVTDAGIKHLAGLNNLRRLVICSTKVTGSGFSDVSDWPKIESINLHSCPVSDEGLAAISRFQNLQRLEIVHCKVTDAGLRQLGKLTNLRQLHVASRGASNRGLGFVEKLSRLRQLDLYEELASNEGLAHVAKLPGLKILSLYAGPADDAGLASLRNLTSLEELTIGGLGKVTDASVGHLAALKSLTQLKVTGTKISATGWQRLRKALPKTRINELK